MSIYFVFFSVDLFKKKHRVLFEDDYLCTYLCVPYIVLSQKMYNWHHGKDKILKKEKNTEKKKDILAVS